MRTQDRSERSDRPERPNRNGGGQGGTGGGNSPHHSAGRLLRRGPEWKGPIVDYKELELLRKFMTGSSKIISRKRSGTTAQEQSAVKSAIKHARFMALLPYCGT